jgi:DNA polymerase III alpha subunit
MRTDLYGQQIYNELDICSLFCQEPTRVLGDIFVDKPIRFDPDLELENTPKCILYQEPNLSVNEFDEERQNTWFMPVEYTKLDIAKWVLDQCKTSEELQRAGDELLKYSERNMLTLLQYLKYLVDTMRKHNVVWGVGRGSSVASYVLYLIGVHRINSLYYDLDINEFLK